MPDPKPFQKLKPKIKGMRKPSIKTCAFLKPSKMTKEGRTAITITRNGNQIVKID